MAVGIDITTVLRWLVRYVVMDATAVATPKSISAAPNEPRNTFKKVLPSLFSMAPAIANAPPTMAPMPTETNVACFHEVWSLTITPPCDGGRQAYARCSWLSMGAGGGG